MDENFGLIAVALFIGLVVAGGFILWLAIVSLLKIFSWVVIYWCCASVIAAIIALITGFIVPIRVLVTDFPEEEPQLASPDLVKTKRIIKHSPRGFAKHFGWDEAWPLYNPYQAKLDAMAVHADMRTVLVDSCNMFIWEQDDSLTPSIPEWLHDFGDIFGPLSKIPLWCLWAIFIPIPYVAFVVVLYISYIVWLLVMAVIGSIVCLLQLLFISLYRLWDHARMSRLRASVKCPYCYETNPQPVYHCLNPDCTIVHHDISPGPLGIFARHCACGVSFPTTVRGAAEMLVALCPSCGAQLVAGSGSRMTIQLPAFGSVGAGKTRFFAAALTATRNQLAATNGSLTGLNLEADGFLRASAQALDSGTATEKTIHTMRPEGRPLQLTTGSGKTVELQVMDAAGESFTNLQATEELTYVNSAPTMVFVLDPLALPRVQAQMSTARDLSKILVATGDQEEAYASVVDRLNSEAVDLRNRHLAVVLTKTDVLRKLPIGKSLDPQTSDTVRDWLIGIEQDGFVRRIESDFGDVRFFAIDSLVLRDLHDPLNPLRVIDWVLSSQEVPIKLLPSLKPEATSKGPDSNS